MGVSLDELNRWLVAPRENEHLEFKEAKTQFDTQRLFSYCVALANEGGGYLVLGVTDKSPRHVVGTTAHRDLHELAQKILVKLHFRVEAHELAHPDGRVVVLEVPPRPTGMPYHIDGAYLMRVGENLVPMTPDQLRRIFAEGSPSWPSRPAKSGCTPDDVIALLDVQGYFELREQPYPTAREGVIERLLSEKTIVEDGARWAITNLGAILFARRLEDFDGLARKGARVVVYEGTNKLKTKLDQPGSRGYAVGFAGLLDFINSQLPGNEVIEHALRRKVKMFPELALRELVANALIHQDFEQEGTSMMVELYDDRIEVSNPGLPVVPTNRFIDGYQSRNERLANLMRRLRICEEQGSGVDKVIDADCGLPRPRSTTLTVATETAPAARR